MNFKVILAGAAATAAILTAGSAFAQANEPPPTGPVIANLSGSAIPQGGLQAYSYSFTATSALTDLSFAFREDPAFLQLDNVVLTDAADLSNTNLVVNGDFEADTGQSAPTGWTYLNTFGAGFGGVSTAGCGALGSNCYNDGAVQAYDAITQSIVTISGDVYNLSFLLGDNSGATTFKNISDNGQGGTGGDGINLVVYGGDAVPVRDNGVPEPAAWAMMLLGFGGIGSMVRSRRRQAATA